ncbi:MULTISPECIES: hypothetical protein [Streptomyces]|uniref:Preprotein translocase subunit SecB n=1 Tax=Streptomyces sviceus (strain ATCC 29083 / DSM 924 / JCM 4929 / NBRC 13980 / NCIMB 11184 / NRRL 5439 / UC 5370) TaxID=463191 RepID=B5HVM5_STRX2|nr:MULTISPECIES: hypothetical protein [Streptomyces]EDY56880.1 conserved hypothetical protein [Streptomyces sviceus ATCC 29083]MYT07365.1 hypothetical protein [Streptomyces sp. SID5470]
MTDPQGDFAQLSNFVARVDLRGIVAQECHAVRHSGAAPERADVSLDTALSSRPGAVDYRFTLACQAFDASEELVADLSVVLLTSFLFEGDEVSESVYESFGTNIAVMTAYPYLRQHIHDLAGRIGLANFTLGLLKQPNKAQGFSIVATGSSR